VGERSEDLNAEPGENVLYPRQIGHPRRIGVRMRSDEAHRVRDPRTAISGKRAKHRVEREVDAIVLRTAKAGALDGNNREVNLGLHFLAYRNDVVAHDLGPTRAENKERVDVELFGLKDRAREELLATVDDLILAELGAQRRRLGVVAVLPREGTVNKVIAPLRCVRENGAVADP